MATNQTFQKRQKEMARKERQRAKAERKAQRKLGKQSAPQSGTETETELDAPRAETHAGMDAEQG